MNVGSQISDEKPAGPGEPPRSVTDAEKSNGAEPSTSSLRDFYADMKDVDRENEVMRVLGAFKLNPYEMLGLRFDVPPEEVPRAYRKVSLAVHPDKCGHPRANDAFDIIGHAQKELLDPEKKSRLDAVLAIAKESIVKEWKKSAKNDAASQLAAALHGIDSVIEKWAQTDEFHEAWKAKAREVLAKTEWRKRKLAQRIEEETGRLEEEVAKKKKEASQKKEKEKVWEERREERIDSWRSFASGTNRKSGKKAKKDAKAPRLFRPPRPKT